MKESNKRKQKKKIAVISGAIVASFVIGLIVFMGMQPDPVQEMVLIPLSDGKTAWVNAEKMITFNFHNGTKIEVTAIQWIDLMDMNDVQRKIVNLKDGTIQYSFHHSDTLGAKSKD